MINDSPTPSSRFSLCLVRAVTAICAVFAIFAGFTAARGDAQVATPPNIVFILLDDVGYNDVSFNGQDRFQTPNIDRLAAEGIIFTDHYAGSTVCAPARATLLTGNHTGRVWQRGNHTGPPHHDEIQFRRDPHDITIATRLKEAGYHTAMIGKSGVACNSDDATLPNDKGFDHFFGFLAHRAAHRYYPRELTRNGETVIYPNNHEKEGDTYSGELFLEDALKYLDEQAETEAPFFLHLALQQAHADLAVPEEYRQRFVGKFEEEPFAGGHYRAESHPAATHAAMITYADDTVGAVLEKLKELEIAENTLVIFTTDNGSFSEGGYQYRMHNSNAPFRGGKRDLYEGGIRAPTALWWPGTIDAGARTGHISAFWDFAPTALELAGLPVPEEMDGLSFLPTLLGRDEEQEQHTYLYWEFHEQGGKQAVRYGDWKGVRLNIYRQSDPPIELYNLADDPGESRNLADAHPEIVEQLAQYMDEAHEPNEHFNLAEN